MQNAGITVVWTDQGPGAPLMSNNEINVNEIEVSLQPRQGSEVLIKFEGAAAIDDDEMKIDDDSSPMWVALKADFSDSFEEKCFEENKS